MPAAMPRPRPPHLHKETTRHGRTVWYVRIDKGARIRLNEVFGTPAFNAAYQAALAGEAVPTRLPGKPAAGTVSWAIGIFRRSTAWTNLSPATRKQRDGILEKIVKSPAGAASLTALSRKHIVEGCKRRAETPAAARHFLETMRALFRWALDENLVPVDPTVGVIASKAKKTEGFPVWSDEDLAVFEARWPRGTRERVAFDVLLYTGLRRGDAVTVGRQHVKGGVIRIKTAKTGEPVSVVICPELEATLAAGPCGDLTFIAGERGRPRVKESFGEWFREACQAAGVRKSAHGLRKAAATRDANDGFTESELEAKYGWRGGRMASHYTRTANREQLSISAAAKTTRRKG